MYLQEILSCTQKRATMCSAMGNKVNSIVNKCICNLLVKFFDLKTFQLRKWVSVATSTLVGEDKLKKKKKKCSTWNQWTIFCLSTSLLIKCSLVMRHLTPYVCIRHPLATHSNNLFTQTRADISLHLYWSLYAILPSRLCEAAWAFQVIYFCTDGWVL